MDDGEGRFRELESLKDIKDLQDKTNHYGGVFSVGDELEIRGSRFKVAKITQKKLILRLQPSD